MDVTKTLTFTVEYPDPVRYGLKGFSVWKADDAAGPWANVAPENIPTLPPLGENLVGYQFDLVVLVPLDGQPHEFWFRLEAYDAAGAFISTSIPVSITLTESAPIPVFTVQVA